jgi:hypothetical protein
MSSEPIPQWLLAQLADGRGWVSASHRVGALGATGATTVDEMAAEILRLRGIIEAARHYVGEGLEAHAYGVLCGMGLQDGIDPWLVHTPHGARLIQAVDEARAATERVEQAERELDEARAEVVRARSELEQARRVLAAWEMEKRASSEGR